MNTERQPTRRSRFVGAALAAGTLLLVGAAALVPDDATTQDIALESYHGRWVLDANAANQRNLASGIDRVVDQLNIFIREIARGEIHRRITAEQRIDIYVTGEEQAALTFDAWGPHTYDLRGTTINIRNREGNPVRSSCRFHNGRLVHRQVHTQGTRENVLMVNPEGSRLTMAVSISADQLPSNIRYRLTFSRGH